MKPPERLERIANIYRQRNPMYGDNYKRFGTLVQVLIPGGIQLEGPADVSRLGLLFHILDKLTRYCAQFNNGGHPDSLDDMAVYGMMLQEVDHELRDIKIVMANIRAEQARRDAESAADAEVPSHLEPEAPESANTDETELEDVSFPEEPPLPFSDGSVASTTNNGGIEPATMKMRDGRTLQEALDEINAKASAVLSTHN